MGTYKGCKTGKLDALQVFKNGAYTSLRYLLSYENKLVNLQFYKPIGSMYGIFTYIWSIFMVNVSKYTIHGSYGR